MAAQIRPSRILLATGGSTTFNALFSGAPPTTVRWTISGGGSLDNTGTTSAEFVAGSTPGSYTITLLADGPNNAETAQATATIQIASASAGNPPAPPPSDPTPSNPPPPANPTPPNPPPANPTPSNPPPPANPTPPNPPPSNPPPATNSTARLFTSSAAAWLYSAPTGAGLNISSIARNLPFGINSHQQGFDYPVQYTDGAHGCTNFNDTGHWGYNDQFCVPNPANGFWPSVGGWGANDGHLVVVDTATGDFYDFWKLYANGAGQPTSNNVGQIVKGNLHTSAGGPGTTAAQISGLAGDIMPGELDCATCLNHALSVVVPGSMNSSQLGHQAPVTHTDGSVPGGIFREGAKIRLDPGLNLSSIQASTAAKAIMRALQLYGAVITDQTGGNGVSFYTSLPTDPDLTGLNQIGQHLWIYY